MGRSLVVITLLIGFVVAAYGALTVLDLLARTESRSSRPLPIGDRVDLETGSGDVTVVAAGGSPRLELETVKGLWGAPEVKVSRGAGGRVSVDADCRGPFSHSCSVELRVLIPRSTTLVARTGSGTVDVRGVQGGVDAETGSGDVELSDVGGERVRADTGSGTVRASRVDAAEVVAETGSGDVELAAIRAPDATTVDTGSGTVELTVPDVGYAFELDTGSGDEQVDVRRDPGAPRRIGIDTGSGDIRVRAAR